MEKYFFQNSCLVRNCQEKSVLFTYITENVTKTSHYKIFLFLGDAVLPGRTNMKSKKHFLIITALSVLLLEANLQSATQFPSSNVLPPPERAVVLSVKKPWSAAHNRFDAQLIRQEVTPDFVRFSLLKPGKTTLLVLWLSIPVDVQRWPIAWHTPSAHTELSAAVLHLSLVVGYSLPSPFSWKGLPPYLFL